MMVSAPDGTSSAPTRPPSRRSRPVRKTAPAIHSRRLSLRALRRGPRARARSPASAGRSECRQARARARRRSWPGPAPSGGRRGRSPLGRRRARARGGRRARMPPCWRRRRSATCRRADLDAEVRNALQASAEIARLVPLGDPHDIGGVDVMVTQRHVGRGQRHTSIRAHLSPGHELAGDAQLQHRVDWAQIVDHELTVDELRPVALDRHRVVVLNGHAGPGRHPRRMIGRPRLRPPTRSPAGRAGRRRPASAGARGPRARGAPSARALARAPGGLRPRPP